MIRTHRVLGIPIPKTLVIWASPSHITLAIWVRVTVDAHITRVWEWGCPCHCDTALTNHNGILHRHLNFPYTAKQSVLLLLLLLLLSSERRAQKFHTDEASLSTKIWVVLLIGWSEFPSWHDQSEALTYLLRSVKWRVISMEFLRSFLRRHFAGKPFVASRKVGCFLRLICSPIGFFQPEINPLFWPKIWHGLNGWKDKKLGIILISQWIEHYSIALVTFRGK